MNDTTPYPDPHMAKVLAENPELGTREFWYPEYDDARRQHRLAVAVRDSMPIGSSERRAAESQVVAALVDWTRAETDSCQAGTPGCCINHMIAEHNCETW